MAANVEDIGTDAERALALRVCQACKQLNDAIFAAAFNDVNVKIVDVSEDWDQHSNLIVERMERRTRIIPAASSRS